MAMPVTRSPIMLRSQHALGEQPQSKEESGNECDGKTTEHQTVTNQLPNSTTQSLAGDAQLPSSSSVPVEVLAALMSTMESLKSAVDDLREDARRKNDEIVQLRSQLTREPSQINLQQLSPTSNPLLPPTFHIRQTGVTPLSNLSSEQHAAMSSTHTHHQQLWSMPHTVQTLPKQQDMCGTLASQSLSYEQSPPSITHMQQPIGEQLDQQSSSTSNTVTQTISQNKVAPLINFTSGQHVSTPPTYTPHQLMSTNAELGTRLYPLPAFDGKPEEWPLFMASYNDSSAEFGYSNRQNLMRLQKALQGDAKSAVVSMLIYPENVPQIIEELKFNFGRSDLLIKSQLDKIKHYPAITEGRLEGVLGLANCARNIVAFFKSAKCEHHLVNPTLLEQIALKLPLSKQYEWAKHSVSISPFPTVEHFANWISDLARCIALLPGRGAIDWQPQHQPAQTRRVLHSTDHRTSRTECPQCKGEHIMSKCQQIQNMSVDDRWQQVKRLRVCFACLRKGHGLTQCRSRQVCNVNGCTRYHHHILHQDTLQPTNTFSDGEKSETILQCHRNESSCQLFKILPVKLFGPKGTIVVYALLDEGSSVSLLEEEVATSLGLRGQRSSITLQWYDNIRRTESSMRANLEISATETNAEKYPMKNLLTIKELSLPVQSFKKEDYNYLSSIPILNYSNKKPSMLIGLDNCHLGVPVRTIEVGPNLPIASATKLGWVVYGPTRNTNTNAIRICHINDSQVLKNINKMVEDYFSIEHFGVRATDIILESDENIRARYVMETTTRRVGDHYETGLLWKSDEITMPESFQMAKKRLVHVESKMARDPVYADRYKAEMKKYIEKGYAKLISPDSINVGETKRMWYLPHFGVINPHKANKLRIVFDAAAVSADMSLNSALLKGPEHAKSLQTILYQFRQGRIAIAGDIKEMFSRVSIISNDQDSQRFLWRNERSEPIEVYAMKSMIFGAICSPCCAEYIKNLNAEHYRSMMPKGADAVINHTYVDDLVISFDTPEEALKVTKQTIDINAAANFELRNFSSNDAELESLLNRSPGEKSNVAIKDKDQAEKILGLYWNKATDNFKFRLTYHRVCDDLLAGKRSPTKREILSIVMSIFDPFGFLTNFTLFSKLLLQKLWKLGIQWDEQLPRNILAQWNSWWKNFQNVNIFSIPRCYSSNLLRANDIQLHIFVDASSSAYAAVAYLRVEYENEIQTSFVIAKSRCAPPRSMTIPRLELQAAVLGCRLKTSIVENHEFATNRIIFWTDSKTVVSWIQSTVREYKQFVACRISEILSTTNSEQWRWLPSELNVADEATRAKHKLDFENNCRWLNGPEFLKLEEQCWPTKPLISDADYCQSEDLLGRVLHVNADLNSFIDFTRYSRYLKTKRVVAWVKRFVDNTKSIKGCRISGELEAKEIEAAERIICRMVQNESFSSEKQYLAKVESVPKSSSIFQLTPYLDDESLLRVNGRIDNAYCLPDSARRPIIMPTRHYVTELIVDHYHRMRHHQNDHAVMNEVRQKFWIPNIRLTLKTVKRNCPTYIRSSAKPVSPLMGQLPVDRLTPFVRPFSYVGLDYCGPFNITIGRRNEKRWIALFTCLGTRALHLELAENLSTDSFLICLRNFVNRRGVPIRIRSDNGTNFIGAQKEIKAETRYFDFEEIQRTLSKDNIEWLFNCPANPHAGGCWERLVQCVKRLLHKVFQEDSPRLETFRSVMIEAENIINNRPLTQLPIDPNTEEPLTPNHFLLGGVSSTQTPNPNAEIICLRKQWRVAQNLKDRLWKRWVVEYLPQLIRRPKWREETPGLQLGDLVIILDPSQPRSQWQTGRITKTFTAKDGQVRSAEVKTSRGLIRRPAVRLATLKFKES